MVRASWEQIGQDYRESAEGQHNLWTGKWGGEPRRSGLDDAGYAAIKRWRPLVRARAPSSSGRRGLVMSRAGRPGVA
jgi:hypothetical protein